MLTFCGYRTGGVIAGGRHRSRAGRAFATAAAGLALCAADAAAARIESDPLTVEIDDWGAANGFTADGRRVFEGADPTLRLRLADGEVFEHPDRTGGTSGPVVRNGAVQRQVTTYRLGPFAVEQTTSVRDGDAGYGIRWRLRNTGAASLVTRWAPRSRALRCACSTGARAAPPRRPWRPAPTAARSCR